MEDTVDPSVGFVVTAKPGIRVEKGQRLATIHARSKEGLALGRSILDEAIVTGDSAVGALPLVSHRVTARGVEELLKAGRRSCGPRTSTHLKQGALSQVRD